MKHLMFLVALILSGCAQQIVLPNGETAFAMQCNDSGHANWGNCYKVAGDKCPAGYEVVAKTESDATNVAVTNTALSGTQGVNRELIFKSN